MLQPSCQIAKRSRNFCERPASHVGTNPELPEPSNPQRLQALGREFGCQVDSCSGSKRHRGKKPVRTPVRTLQSYPRPPAAHLHAEGGPNANFLPPFGQDAVPVLLHLLGLSCGHALAGSTLQRFVENQAASVGSFGNSCSLRASDMKQMQYRHISSRLRLQCETDVVLPHVAVQELS